MMEEALNQTLSALVAGRAFPDDAPYSTQRPYITWQQVGGDVINAVANQVANKRNAEIQVNVWADSRPTANTLALAVEQALVTSTAFVARPIGAFVATREEDVDIRGTRQDFTIWSER